MVLGFVFGFDDKMPVFELSFWLLNFIKFALLSFISLAVFAYIPNLFAGKYGCTADYQLWSIKQYGFKAYQKLPVKFLGKPVSRITSLPLGIILPILIALISNGSLYFTATLAFITTINPAYRIGKKFASLTEYENAKLALISPVSAILLAVFSKVIFPGFHEFILINSMLAISYMVPLPKLNGCTILFGSKPLYLFALLFILLTSLLLNFIAPITAALIAISFAIIMTLFYLIKIYKD